MKNILRWKVEIRAYSVHLSGTVLVLLYFRDVPQFKHFYELFSAVEDTVSELIKFLKL